MKIACEACGAKYTIADDKVRGRRVKIRCKGCGTPIVVDGQHGGDPSISDAETDTALETEGPVTWSVNLSDTDSRTMSSEEIVAAYASGVVTADAFVWKDGMPDWVPLLDSELAPLLPSAPAAGTAASSTGARGGGMPLFTAPNQATHASRPAATTHATQPNTQDLFGSLDTAGSEEEVASGGPSVPQAGSGAYDDGKLTGARNENSVLFSLDALKAGFSPSAPSAAKPSPKVPAKGGPGAARPQQPSNPDDPFGMSAAAGLMGGSGALFGADNQALMTAPAPPPPPAAPVASPFVAGALPAAYLPKSNKLVYIVGGVGGVIIIGLLLALLSGKKSDSSATADNSGMPSASAAPLSATEKPAEEAKKDEPAKPAETASPAASASASAAPSASAASTGKPSAVAQSGGVTTPKKPKEDAPPPADAQPFSKASAISALGAAASSAGSCKKPGGPTGPGKATVTFAPSGRVTTATVAGGSYAGTGVGGCVASVFRRAHVPPFSGSSVTVSKSFQIN